MRTTYITKPLEVERKWYVVDAEGQTLGRLCTQIAHMLRGKHKTVFSPNADVGDHIIVVNAEKIAVTGKKMNQKMYVRHSGYIGSRRETSLKDMLRTKPEEVIKHAVKGMLPKNNLGKQMLSKFYVYAGPNHRHEAQKPEVLKFD